MKTSIFAALMLGLVSLSAFAHSGSECSQIAPEAPAPIIREIR
jgi:hypothetical protein